MKDYDGAADETGPRHNGGSIRNIQSIGFHCDGYKLPVSNYIAFPIYTYTLNITQTINIHILCVTMCILI